MKKGKLLFIALVVLVFAGGMFLYIQKHGALRTSGQADTAAAGISAGQAVLIDGNTGKVLYEKAADEKAYPASTTKIMTAMITLETLMKYDSPIDQLIEVPRCAEGVEGSSLYLKAGEKISIEDLLYGLMLVSGNDAAVALAEVIGGSQEEFVEMMNIRAAELGCSGTNFVNPNGLFDENHYTTARDMALIAYHAMKNETFRKIVAAQQWKATSRESTYVTFRNKNKTVFQYEGGNGIKIGYTENSGRTLVASAQRGEKIMICVVMSAPDWFNDAYKLMDQGFRKEQKK
ncbi:MAG: D-alanyl-D-alanine carboxypeptidase family protein [Lentihominibacter sp.]